MRRKKIHYILFNILFFSLNFLLERANTYLVLKLLEGLKYLLSPQPKLIFYLGQNGSNLRPGLKNKDLE
jgi:hypothetical protein